MRRVVATSVVLFAAAVMLSGCALGPEGIFRTFDIDNKNVSVVTDAKQRVITTRRPEVDSRPGLVAPHAIVCAEPSPDVATALTGSFGSSLSIFSKGAGSISAAQAEGLAQLAERTASIQLMRDQMYRACEAYANGAITGTNYSLLMSQINNTMVTLLMGETAGGAFGRSLSALGGKGSSEASASMSGIMTDVQQSTAALTAAEVKVNQAQKDLDDANAALSKTPDDQTAKDSVTSKKTALSQAEGERDAIRDTLQGHLDAASKAAAEITSVTAAGGITAKPDAAVASVLGDMQKTFVNRDPSYELVEACLVELGMWNSDPDLRNGAISRFNSAVQEEEDNGYNKELNYNIATAQRSALQTGLYSFCAQNLPSIAPSIVYNDYSLAASRVDNEGKSLELQLVTARAKAASDVASGLAQCAKITEDASVRAACISAVYGISRTAAPGPSPAPPPEPAPATKIQAPEPVNLDVLPTKTFDKAKAALANLNDAYTKLNNDDHKKKLSDKTPDATDADAIKTKATLTKRLQDISTAAKGVIDSATPKLASRSDAEGFERQQSDLESQIDLQKDPDLKKILTSQLGRVRSQAKALQDDLSTLTDVLDASTQRVAGLIQDIEKFVK